jgi:hypothetical protein
VGPVCEFNKTEYMAVNSEFPRDLLTNDLIALTPVSHCKYLGVSTGNDGGWNVEINQRIKDAKRMVGCLNSYPVIYSLCSIHIPHCLEQGLVHKFILHSN